MSKQDPVRYSLRSASMQRLFNEEYHARDTFSLGLLPSDREIIEIMIQHLMPRGKGFLQKSKAQAAEMVAEMLYEQWVWCNIYPKEIRTISKAVLNLYTDCKLLTHTPKSKQTSS
jgi:hypothetical protein